MDEEACNYDPNATLPSDVSFTENFDSLFAPELFDDQDSSPNDYISSPYMSITSGSWEVLQQESFDCGLMSPPNSLVYNTANTSYNTTISFASPAHDVSFVLSNSAWIDDSYTVTILVHHSLGQSEYQIENSAQGSLVEISESSISSLDILIPNSIVYGCIDNFSYSISSCTYPGCIDESSCNYDSEAGCDDGSCSYPGCTD